MTQSTPEIITTASGVKAAIHYVTIGQNFGTVAHLKVGKRVIAETEIVPLGFTGAAYRRVIALASTL